MSGNNRKQPIIALVGPTASGKTTLALTLAEAFGGEIISADSRQVYRGLDIGTDKIAPDEMRGIPHHCIDVAEPEDVFTAADFKRCGEKSVRYIVQKNRLPIIAGGTGFYVDTLLGLIPVPEVPPNQELRDELENHSTETLFEKLSHVAPERARTIDAQNPRRLIRALEIYDALGYIPSMERHVSPYAICWVGIDRPDAEYATRIPERAQKWLSRGFLDEIAALEAKNIPETRWHEFGFEYALGRQLLHGDISEELFTARFLEKNMQYINRQRKYFKRNADIRWFHPEEVEDIEKYVTTFL